jgi:hypothetical protein
MKTLSPHIRRAGILAMALGVAAAPAVAATAAGASVTAAPLTASCGVIDSGPLGVEAYCWGSGSATLTVVCTNGTAWGLVFAPATLTVTCPAGGTMIRWTLT